MLIRVVVALHAIFSLVAGLTLSSALRLCSSSLLRVTARRLRFHLLAATEYQSIFEEEEELKSIAEKYLLAKYKGCVNGVCRFICDKEEVKAVLRSVLPPVSATELEREVESTMKKMPGDEITQDQFLAAFMDNTYWNRAGPLVVKELIYLDSLQAFYYLREKLLDDEDFDALKEMLTWEGSSAATLNSKEARFISGVAAFRKGSPFMSDEEYGYLKQDLVEQKSWVVMRMQDPLEKLGLQTFMGYLHRQMGAD